MPKTKIQTVPNPNSPKEINTGLIGLDSISKSKSSKSKQSGNTGTDWERLGLIESFKPRKGMFFHSLDADGEVENQGHLLALTAKGYGRAQLFEWFFGEPSRVIDVDPDYLRCCIFYTSCAAMNAAYERLEAKHE